MSYSKVRSIKIDEKAGKVFLTSACNNVRPLTYSRYECTSLSKILAEKGRGAVELAILKDYEEGNLQEGTNKFTKAIKVLYFVFGEEYKRFSWRANNAKCDSEEDKEHKILRESQEFMDFLKKCLDYKFPKEKFVITKDIDGEKVFGKKKKWSMAWTRFIQDATKYDFKEEAQNNIYENYKNEWEVRKVRPCKVCGRLTDHKHIRFLDGCENFKCKGACCGHESCQGRN